MAGYLTSETLIESIKRRANIPESQDTYTSDDLLALANEEIDMELLPSILAVKEEFYVFTITYDLESNVSRYSIPERAIGSKLRELFLVDDNGNESSLTRIEPERRNVFNQTNGVSYGFSSFYLEGNDVVLCPGVGSNPTGQLRMYYYLRPNDLVDSDRVATITAIDTATGIITVDTVPSVIAGGLTIDFLQARSNHRTYDIDIEVQSVNSIGPTITFLPADLPSNLIVGDIIALSGECNIPQIPADLHSMLAQAVACRVLEAQNESTALKNAMVKLDRMKANLLTLIDSRTEGNQQIALNTKSFFITRSRNRYF